MSRLMKPIELSSLAEEGIIFQVDTDHVNEHERFSESEDEPETADNCNKECLGVFDEETYEDGDPFKLIAQKMFNLLVNGKIKKRVLREGAGEAATEFATVKIHYNAYLEFDDQPFDSTYARKRPLKFTIGNGQVIAGLDHAVRTMKLHEKAQFLIHPDYAYGKNCLIGRVPPNSHVLFEVELVDIVSASATVTYEGLPEEQKRSFPELYKYCTALCEKAKKLVREHDYKNAIVDYNTAAFKLEKAVLNGRDEMEQQRELCLKLYTNLLICYLQVGKPRKGIDNVKKIYDLTENGEIMKIPAKVYFNHAKCLRVLSDYEEAKTVLEKAYKMEPRNSEIANEMLNLDKDREEHKMKQLQFAKAFIGKCNIKE